MHAESQTAKYYITCKVLACNIYCNIETFGSEMKFSMRQPLSGTSQLLLGCSILVEFGIAYSQQSITFHQRWWKKRKSMQDFKFLFFSF